MHQRHPPQRHQGHSRFQVALHRQRGGRWWRVAVGATAHAAQQRWRRAQCQPPARVTCAGDKAILDPLNPRAQVCEYWAAPAGFVPPTGYTGTARAQFCVCKPGGHGVPPDVHRLQVLEGGGSQRRLAPAGARMTPAPPPRRPPPQASACASRATSASASTTGRRAMPGLLMPSTSGWAEHVRLRVMRASAAAAGAAAASCSAPPPVDRPAPAPACHLPLCRLPQGFCSLRVSGGRRAEGGATAQLVSCNRAPHLAPTHPTPCAVLTSPTVSPSSSTTAAARAPPTATPPPRGASARTCCANAPLTNPTSATAAAAPAASTPTARCHT